MMTAFLAVKRASVVTFICATLLAPGWAQGVFDNSQANNVVTKCGEEQFRCRNGDCVLRELLCDGRADCSDQSDELQIECTKPELTCPDYAFRCTYGACVTADSICNGVRDCVDNSDETLPRCPGVSAIDPDRNCGPADYRCKDGQCINSVSLCDGTIDCADGSDETFISCGSFPCSQTVFRCKYGACISNNLKCDNVSDCADGSDEDSLLCGRSGPGPSTPRPTALPPKPTPKPTPRPIPPGKLFVPCQAPPQPKNGQWRVHKSLCGGIAGGTVDCEFGQGLDLEPGTLLVYTCAPGFTARGGTDVYCGRDGSWSKIPVCTEITCRSLISPSTSAKCSNRTVDWVSCEVGVRPGTRAKVTCSPGYRKDTNWISAGDVVYCDDNGKWDPEPIKCIPVCGRTSTRTSPLSVNGEIANITDFPWHATLYVEKRTSKGLKKEFQCGATIIQTDILLTAAHCVYDEWNKTTIDTKKLFVATGNVFRDYDFPHDERIVRKATVKNVYIYCQYYGVTGNYAADIALLELNEPFELSAILLPACLDLADESHRLLQQGSYGKVAGFGRTATSDTSPILQTITLPYVSYDQCRAATNTSEEVALIGTDKFCAGWRNGSAVCEGDSGGGLVFQKSDRLWYVMGIVSTSLGVRIENGEAICNHFSYSTYTRVDRYMAWIQKAITNLRQDRFFESCTPA